MTIKPALPESERDALTIEAAARTFGVSEATHGAWPLAAWLEEKGQPSAFDRAWREGVKDDPTGEKTFLRVTGATAEDAQPRWRNRSGRSPVCWTKSAEDYGGPTPHCWHAVQWAEP